MDLLHADMAFGSIDWASRALRNRLISAYELCDWMLARIRQHDPALHSYISVFEESALAQAKVADRELAAGIDRGALHGIPVAVKDLLYTEQGTTSGGTAIYKKFAPGYDATVVRRLLRSGAVMLGKLNMTDAGGMLHHPDYKAPLNPYRADLWTGVSSSGSGVATASGLCFASLGSDTGGSIRFPSACNGLTGLRPTWGRVSRHGILHLAPSYDTIGPLCRSASDVAHVMNAIAGHDPADSTSLAAPVPLFVPSLEGAIGAHGVRIGIDWTYVSEGASDDTVQTIQSAVKVLTELGADIVDIEMPDTDELCMQVADLHMAELAHSHAERFANNPELYGDWLRRGIERGLAQHPVRLASAAIQRDIFKGRMSSILCHVDMILLPIFARGTPTRHEAELLTESEPHVMFRFTIPSGAAGLPSLSLPGPLRHDGVPSGFQLVGAACSEAMLLRVGNALQIATGWHLARPELTIHTRQ